MNRNEKKGKFLIIILLLTCITALLLAAPTAKAIFTPPIPSGCSNQNITALWDSIFQVSSNGIKIYTNTTTPGKCPAYLAYKTNNNYAYILTGVDMNMLFVPSIIVIAMSGEFSSEFINYLNTINSPTYPNLSLSDIIPRQIPITSADSVFAGDYKVQPTAWILNTTSEDTVYQFSDNYTLNSQGYAVLGVVSANYTFNSFMFMNISIPQSCIPNWTAANTSSG